MLKTTITRVNELTSEGAWWMLQHYSAGLQHTSCGINRNPARKLGEEELTAFMLRAQLVPTQAGHLSSRHKW